MTPHRPDRDALRSTGTDGTAALSPSNDTSSSSANERERARRVAANTEDGPTPCADVTLYTAATNDNAARSGAASCGKATHRTRTGDLSFTKAKTTPVPKWESGFSIAPSLVHPWLTHPLPTPTPVKLTRI